MSNNGISLSLPRWLGNRAAGVLLHPSSLPSKQGIGTLGKEARQFIDFLESAGFAIGRPALLDRLDLGILPIRYFVQVQVILISLIGVS